MNSAVKRLLRRLRCDEDGASMVVIAFSLPLLILMGAFAVDAANWFVHKRHLQTQADSGALAAARDFQFPCGDTVSDPPNSGIIATAHQYDGTGGSGAYNTQVGNPAPTVSGGTYSATSNDIISLVNASDYFNQDTPGDTDMTGVPCDDVAIDLKLTETNVPLFFKGLYRTLGAEYVNAQARVSLKKIQSGTGAIPLGIPAPTPKAVSAQLVDLTTDTVLATAALSSTDGENWTSGTTDVTFPEIAGDTATRRVGVRVALSGSTTTTCGTTGVECYPSDTSLAQPNTPTTGAINVRSWSGDGTPGLPVPPPVNARPIAPQLQDVRMTTSDCSDAYFTNLSSSCSVRIEADAVFGAGVTCDGTADSPAGLSLSVSPSSGSPDMNCPTSGPGWLPGSATGTWVSDAISITENSGPTTFALDWILRTGVRPENQTDGDKNTTPPTCTTSKECSNSYGTVQQTFAGAPSLGDAETSRSGPISELYLTEVNGLSAYSVRRCSSTTGYTNSSCSRSYIVHVRIYGLENASAISSPSVTLRISDNQGNHALGCQGNVGNSTFTDALATGCPDEIATTTGDTCPSVTPAVCVETNPGEGKKVTDGLNTRIHGGDNCLANRNYWTAPQTLPEVIGRADPRIVRLYVVPLGSLQSNGRYSVPVRALASFYITGYDGSPCSSPSSGTATDTVGTYVRDEPAGNGEVIGHFIKYVASSGSGTGGTETCDPTILGDCVAVLTK